MRKLPSELNYLVCAHCSCEFLATKRQVKRHRALNSEAKQYCSKACIYAAVSISKRRPFPYNAICPNCGISFGSRAPKKFCSLRCYISSAQFKANQRKAADKAMVVNAIKWTGEPPKPKLEWTCLNCGAKGFAKPSAKRRFCNHLCYRGFMAKRFDRWMANPQNIALPQSFDEFLLQEELPCLIEGCDWKGLKLGNHVNFAHGITASEFKRAAGFNLKTGLVTPAVFEALSARPHIQNGGPVPLTREYHPPLVRGYCSLEGREHAAKARALTMAITEMPPRVCQGCGCEYTPTAGAWSSKFHSVECRDRWYAANNKRRIYPMICGYCNRTFDGNIQQRRCLERGKTVCCSAQCKGRRNGRMRKPQPVRDAAATQSSGD